MEKEMTEELSEKKEVETSTHEMKNEKPEETLHKISDRIYEILDKVPEVALEDSWEKLVFCAYWFGREDAARYVSDAYNKVLSEQQDRAWNCRYRKMAMAVQGNINYVYTIDYSGEFKEEFGEDLTRF